MAGYTITPQLKKQFAESMAALLDLFEKMLIALEKKPSDAELINTAFRAVHSIKGESDYIGIKDINLLAHALESLMSDVRSGSQKMGVDILTILFDGLDLLKAMNRRVEDTEYRESNIDDMLGKIESAAAASKEPSTPLKRRHRVDVNAVFAKASAQNIKQIKKVTGNIIKGDSAKGARKNILRMLTTFYTSASYSKFRTAAAMIKEMIKRVESARFVSKNLAVDLKKQILDLEKQIHSKVDTRDKTNLKDNKTDIQDILGKSVPVGPEKLDSFLMRSSELAIAKNALENIVGRGSGAGANRQWLSEMRKVVAGISKISTELNREVMNLRMVRIDSLFERMPRIVRDLAGKQGKKIDLKIKGGATEIDRKVVEHLVDPLIHLIRNAVDHGIETPGQRKKNKKPETGTITVRAGQEGNQAVIEVEDDGFGIDADIIKKTILKKGLKSLESIKDLSDEEIINLIFTPGFTTAKKATPVSGRGVGLDIVKTNIGQTGGSISISGTPGVSTKMRITVPLSMAVQDVLLTEACKEVYAIPFTAIIETIKIDPKKIKSINNRKAVAYYETVIVLTHLSELLGVSQHVSLSENMETMGSADTDDLNVVVMVRGKQVLGVIVDKIIRREGVLTRPFEKQLASISELTGAAILGDGSIVVVLDPMGI